MIDELRQKFGRCDYEYALHAVDQSILKHITRREVEEAMVTGEVIEDYRAASLAAVTCRVKVPMMGGFPFDHLAGSPTLPGDRRRQKRG